MASAVYSNWTSEFIYQIILLRHTPFEVHIGISSIVASYSSRLFAFCRLGINLEKAFSQNFVA